MSTCSTGQRHLTKVAFIALPGVRNDSSILVFNGSNNAYGLELSGATQSFGEFGYELELPEVDRIPFNSGDTLWIAHPYYSDSSLRLLHQVGYETINICWRLLEDGPDEIICEDDYDYPLLAIETSMHCLLAIHVLCCVLDSPDCVEGSLSVAELKSMWESRTVPVVYSSPYRELSLNCSGSGNLSKIVVGTYPLYGATGTEGIEIRAANDNLICNPSTPQGTGQPNVYECVLDPPMAVDEGSLVRIYQRNASRQIGFVHDGERDTPLISVTISES